ncbi:MAG: hypothetical protein GYB35_06375 [Algicola sp.]|nr:hypothetical protein [Algicola sp.]
MEHVFTISIIINILLVFAGSFFVYKRGTITYFKRKLKVESEYSNSPFGIHYDFKLDFFKSMPTKSNEIIFLGDSLTAMSNWNELFEKEKIKNRGISGDKINGVIYRLDEVVRFNPDKIFLMIGVNDLGMQRKLEDIISNYEILINLILSKTPETKLYIQSILPTKNQVARQNSDILEINKELVQLSKKYKLTFINLFDIFKTEDNELNMDFSYDGLHLNAEGYLLWKKTILKYVED